MARRSFYSQVKAASKLPSSSTRSKPTALAPFCWAITHHMQENKAGYSIRVRWKIVPEDSVP